MGDSKVIAVVPARWGSTRFPGKAVAEIAGKPMIVRVVEGASDAERIDEVLVATDDERIAEAVAATPAEAVMTPEDCASGSDRVARVVRDRSVEIVVNVQGDQPLIQGEHLDRGVAALREDEQADLVSFMAPCPEEDVEDPDRGKVVVDRQNRALYFSRSPVPYRRNDGPIYGHVGVYVFRRETLLAFTEWDPTPLERAESLEQLRVLEHGGTIRMVKLEHIPPEVDRPEDVERVERVLKGQNGREFDTP